MERNNKKCKMKRLPYQYYTTPVFFIVLSGLIANIYLAWSHYQNYTNINYTSFCALTKSLNCDTVAQSPWSIFLGLPLSHYGIFSYLIFFLFLTHVLNNTKKNQNIWYLLFFISFTHSVISIYLGYISTTQIKSYCLLCMVIYAINFTILTYCFIIIRRFCSYTYLHGLLSSTKIIVKSRLLICSIFILFCILITIRFLIPTYWHLTPPPLSVIFHSGFTEQGAPWIGAEKPKLTIHEYADYQCFQCSKMHLFLRQLIATHPDSIRLVHHHYPMDHEFNNVIVPEPFHVGSGKMAMLAIYAASRGKFWEMNDALYSLGRSKEPFNTKTLGKTTGFSGGELAAATRHPQIRNALLQEIRRGMKLEITGTPTFVIDGKVYPGAIPAQILQPYLQ